MDISDNRWHICIFTEECHHRTFSHFNKHIFPYTLAEATHLGYQYGLLSLYCHLSQCSSNEPSVGRFIQVQSEIEILKKKSSTICTLLFGGCDYDVNTETDKAAFLVFWWMLTILTQLGTTLKGHSSFRAPHDISHDHLGGCLTQSCLGFLHSLGLDPQVPLITLCTLMSVWHTLAF